MTHGRNLSRMMVVALTVFLGFLFIKGHVALGKAPCPYKISSAKAAAILDIKPTDLGVRSFPQMVSPDDTKNKTYKVPPCSYGYRSKSNFRKAFSYVVYTYNDPQRARRDYTTMKGNFSTAAKVEELSGLGDAAFWVNDSRFPRLVAVKGNVLIDVMNPRDVKLRKQVAALVLGVLGK